MKKKKKGSIFCTCKKSNINNYIIIIYILIKKSFKFSISFSCINKFNNFIKAYKDGIEFMSNNNVHKIQCKDGDVSYWIDKKQLKIRIKEHMNNVTGCIETFNNY